MGVRTLSEEYTGDSISQIEEIGFDLFWDRKDELRTALEQLASNQRLDFSALLVTDVVSNGSLLLLKPRQIVSSPILKWFRPFLGGART